MNDIHVFGLSHNSAPLAAIAKLTIGQEKRQSALDSLKRIIEVDEVVWLSTCNRFEIYFTKKTTVTGQKSKHQNREIIKKMNEWLAQQTGHKLSMSENSCYLYANHDAITHLMRISSGLDSMILGESQILGQVKSAFQRAQQARQTGAYLSKLFIHAIMVGKRVRSGTTLGRQPNSYASLAVKLAHRFYEDLHRKKVLMIGSGEMIELMTKHFVKKNINRITIAGRNSDKTRRLAKNAGAAAASIDQIEAMLPQHDLVISCTASAGQILDRDAIEKSMRRRKNKLVCMIDLALPPDIAPEAKKIEGVYYYDLEHFSDLLAEKKTSQIYDIQEAEAIVQAQADAYFAWIKTRKFVGLIQTIQARADFIQNKTLGEIVEKAKNKKWEPDVALRKLAMELTKKLTLPVVERINQAAENECDYEILRAAERLHGLDVKEWSTETKSMADKKGGRAGRGRENEPSAAQPKNDERTSRADEKQAVAGGKKKT